jgi:flagellar biosynthesis/type III secretory pathway chaperone
MEASIVQVIETLIHQKIMLYNDLVHCFKQERESLVRIDLDVLWEVSKGKEEAGQKIKDLRQEIMAAIFPEKKKKFNMDLIIKSIPKAHRAKFHHLWLRLTKLKSEIEAMRRDNVMYLNDSISFLDEMISILTGGENTKSVYDKKGHMTRTTQRCLLSNEV